MRRSKKDQIDSVVFDDDARLEFLTGFHKRKLLKKETAKTKAKERERQERLQARKDQRQALKERAEQNARQVETACNQNSGNDESDDEGAAELSVFDKGKRRATQEFEDEQQLATVTVVEEFDPDPFRRGALLPPIAGPLHSEPEILVDASRSGVQTEGAQRVPNDHSSNKPTSTKTKTRPKRVTYETKSARKATRNKQYVRKLEKADRAGSGVRRKDVKRPGKAKR